MSTYSELHEELKKHEQEFKAKLKDLQERCPHPSISEWMDEWWTEAHSTGYQVQECNVCHKELHRKIGCWICGKTLVDQEIVKGKGHGTAVGAPYCREDFDREEREYAAECHSYHQERIDEKHGLFWECELKLAEHAGKKHTATNRNGTRTWE